MRRSGLLILFLAMITAGSVIEGHSSDRVALVVGNSDYVHTQSLPNPARDATAVADKLRGMGFNSVSLKLDLDLDSMTRAITEFAARARGADIAVIFYAGHGMEAGGDNFLVPVNARIKKEADIRKETVRLSSALDAVRSAARLGLIVLDACRNNPLSTTLQLRSGARFVRRGFARVEPRGDMLVAYAAAAGTTAQDGDGPHSPYTSAILAHLDTPGLDVRRLFGRVRDDVLKATGQVQEPATYGSLGGDAVYLVPPAISKNDGADRARQSQRDPADPVKASPKERDRKKVAVGVSPNPPQQAAARSTKPGDRFRDCEVCPEMIVIPPGRFVMGSPNDENGRNKDEGPLRTVNLRKPIAIGKFEVTKREFERFARETGHDAGSLCTILDAGKKKWVNGLGRSFRDPGISQSDDHPAPCLSWRDAKAYVSWLSDKTGQTYRLLSEAEWEYAARAGTTSAYGSDDDWTRICEYANGPDIQSCDDGHKDRAAPVGQYKPNAFGLHDMQGNLWEWVEDCSNRTYAGAPTDGTPWTSQGDCSKRVVRGGSWDNDYTPSALRLGNRAWENAIRRNSSIGLRVAREL